MKRKKKKSKIKNPLLTVLIAICLTVFYWFHDSEASSFSNYHPPEDGGPPVLYSNMDGDHLQRTFSTAISNAKSSVHLLIYALTDKKLIATLKKKSEEGIPVKVVYDAKASAGVDQKLGPLVKTTARASDGLMHQKILVIDAQEVWLGSANFTADSLFSQSNLVTAVNSQALANQVIEKVASFSEGAFEKEIPSQQFQIGQQKLELYFLPDCHFSAVQRIEDLIASAKKTIQVAMFTFTREDFAKTLINAKKRGVKVEVFLDHQSSKGASAKIAALLKKAGIPLYTNPGKSIFHCKFLLIDNEILVNGSANWTKAAFKQNDDCFIIVHQLNDQQKQKMAQIYSHLKEHMVSLKLALFGHGKMGKAVREMALLKEHQIVETPILSDLCIDFTHSDCVLKNIEAAALNQKNIVVGTTGWEGDLEVAKKIAQEANIGLLYSPNFSIGVHLFIKLLKQTGMEMAKHPEYDIAGLEIHHKTKIDSPSGTAKTLSKVLYKELNKNVPFSSVRCGDNPGTHTLIFDSPSDTITLTHSAKGRQAFAAGAIKAAEWLHGKKGFYTLEDIL